jgi:hypothetical protein
MAAMTGRAAALSGMVELPIWAVSDIRHQGRIADIRCALHRGPLRGTHGPSPEFARAYFQMIVVSLSARA